MPPEKEKLPPTPIPPAPEEPYLHQIRTFQGDVASALKKQNESLFSIQQQEIKRNPGLTAVNATPETKIPQRRSGYFLLLLGSILLLTLTGVGGWYTYHEFIRKTATPIISTPASRFISTESESELDFTTLTRETFFSAVESGVVNIKANELHHFVLREGSDELAPLTPATKFFEKLQSRAPGSLVRAFEPTFMLGSAGQSRFLLIKVSSFENAFAGMLNWEKDVAVDLGDLFASGARLKTIPPESVFRDVISKNKDVRVLYAEDNASSTSPALLYSFFDNDTLIITDQLNTLQTLIDRLTREQLTR
jgi:hypothetical protein